jgi:hypothetical protein
MRSFGEYALTFPPLDSWDQGSRGESVSRLLPDTGGCLEGEVDFHIEVGGHLDDLISLRLDQLDVTRAK